MSGLKWVDIENIEGNFKEPPRTSWILVSEKTVGAKNLAMGEEEVMYFLQGKGQFVTDEETIELKPGICIYNPPGSFHTIINTGDEILKFVWIYSPQLDSHRNH
jgi:mannose-6-phosphate isomerase-like protein (cupin superfamily)